MPDSSPSDLGVATAATAKEMARGLQLALDTTPAPDTAAAPVDWERIAREAVLHVIRHREDFHNASTRPCGTCDRSAAFLRTLPDDVARPYVDSSCTERQRNGR